MATYHDALVRPDAIEFYGNRRFIVESACPLQIVVKGRDRYVVTAGLGFERGQRVTKAGLARAFWQLKRVIGR
jgi:hypothetical protein